MNFFFVNYKYLFPHRSAMLVNLTNYHLVARMPVISIFKIAAYKEFVILKCLVFVYD